MMISAIKTVVFAALFYAVTFTAVHDTPGVQAETISCDDAPGMEGCNDARTSSSSSAKQDRVAVPRMFKLHKTITFDDPTFVQVNEDLVLLSDNVIDTINMHFVVHEGVTLTFQAPAVKIARDETSTSPLFKLSGTVRFQATGSTPVLLDGSLTDDAGIVQVTGEDTVFLSDRDDIVRYHKSGITVSRMEHTGGDLDGPHREEVELSPELKASLATYHAKFDTGPDVPPSTFFSSSPSSSSSSFPTSTTSSRPFSSSSSYSSSTPEVVDKDGDGDVCVFTPYFDTLDGPGYCPNPAFCRANTATITSPGSDETGTPATASTNCSDDTSSACTSARDGGDGNNGSSTKDHEHGHDGGSGSNSGVNKDQTPSATAPVSPTPTARDVNPSVSTPKRVLIVGDTLKGPLTSSTGMSAIWTEKYGSIVFGRIAATSSNASGGQNLGRVRSTILVFSNAGQLNRVLRAREVLIEEMREGSVPTHERRRPWGWGWVPCRSRLHEDVERARGRMGELELTLSDRGGLEVTMDGTRVLSKSGRFSREWMNRFPWRRSKNTSYELHVKDDGIEVRLGEKVIWEITADDMMD